MWNVSMMILQQKENSPLVGKGQGQGAANAF